jgi:hypothetical protein
MYAAPLRPLAEAFGDLYWQPARGLVTLPDIEEACESTENVLEPRPHFKVVVEAKQQTAAAATTTVVLATAAKRAAATTTVFAAAAARASAAAATAIILEATASASSWAATTANTTVVLSCTVQTTCEHVRNYMTYVTARFFEVCVCVYSDVTPCPGTTSGMSVRCRQRLTHEFWKS